jgi:hypothetical protein
MLRDVFYYGNKPNVHPREQFAENLADARLKSTTHDFWIINEFCDYRNFDWDFDFELLPDEDVWAEDHNNVWPSQHQKDSGTWLCPKEHSDLIIYRGDVDPVKRKNERTSSWVLLDNIDDTKFDFSWHPDPTAPPYIYKWGCKFFPAELKHVLEYHVEGATSEKYMNVIAELLPNNDYWTEHDLIDKTKFDMSWRPDPLDSPFIYVWGNKWVDGKLKPTLTYRAPNAVDTKYMPEHIPVLPEWDKWVEIQAVDKNKFDFTWRPDPREPAYIYTWGNKHIAAQDRPTLEYHCDGATDRKYMDEQVPVLPEWERWKILQKIDLSSFDFTWRPDPKEPPLTYVFGNELYDAVKMPTIMYNMPDGPEIKYLDTLKATLVSDLSKYEHLEDAYLEDYSWVPDPDSPPYIYAWGNQWNKPEDKISIQYSVKGATEYMYMEARAIRKPNMDNWVVPDKLDVNAFDFSWEPNPNEEPYIYEFGTQWQKTGGPQYIIPGATEKKYVDVQTAIKLPSDENWKIIGNIASNGFDFSWHPDSTEEPYIYVFGNQWYSAEKESAIEYRVPGATTKKYVIDLVATLSPDMTNWETPDSIDATNFDYSWHPDPDSPAYIYQFGTQLDNTDGPRYITPGNTGEIVYLERVNVAETLEIAVGQYYIETTLEDLVNEHPNEVFWALRKNINYDTFDFTWQPELRDLEYVQVFGSTESELAQTYYVSAKNYLKGNTDFKFVEDLTLDTTVLSNIFVKPDMFFVDRSNPESIARFEALRAKFGTRIQKTRYLNSWVDTISRCNNRATTELLWVLNSELDYADFNFDYYPNPWQMKMVQVFGTQWSHWGTTFMVNRETFKEDTKYIKVIEHLPNLNFVKNIKANATQCTHDIIVIDHGNAELPAVLETINSKACGRNVTTITYNISYFDTLKEILKGQQEKKEHYIWICSSVCDYNDFDFSYICDPYAKDQLHVFPSGMQKFGDTFFVDVNLARELIDEMEKLEDFRKVNFNPTIKAKRLPEPVIVTSNDTHVEAIKNVTGFPYATIITGDNVDIEDTVVEPMNLWFSESKNILITSTGGTRIVVPIEAKDYVTSELYEYPYIKRMPKLAKSKALDIVFVSNGERVAEQNYEHLCEFTRGLPNKINRVDGINGRTEALHAAAECSETPWFFCVPAKLFINKKFDWNYQADRMQMPKHYIFNALNPVNDLYYGHQSLVLYNKNLILGNNGVGLDFTLDSPHTSVELNSGIVVGDTDEHSTWRTAFREAVKLKKYSENGDEVAKQRLDIWTTIGKGTYGEWSIKGALDGIEFFYEVDGDLDKLRQSYYWDWLKARFESKY